MQVQMQVHLLQKLCVCKRFSRRDVLFPQLWKLHLVLALTGDWLRPFLAAEGESHLTGFARLQVDVLESGQPFFVGGDAAQHVAHVELHHFIAGALSGVGHLAGGCDALVGGGWWLPRA